MIISAISIGLPGDASAPRLYQNPSRALLECRSGRSSLDGTAEVHGLPCAEEALARPEGPDDAARPGDHVAR
ncbi:hypothetical protein NKG05_16920 [Oerskovia sp. M15]